MTHDPRHPVTPPERDVAATKRSYVFLVGASVALWAVFLGVATAMHASGHGGFSTSAYLAVAAVGTATLGGWVLFLRGLRRRDLERIEGGAPRRKGPVSY